MLGPLHIFTKQKNYEKQTYILQKCSHKNTIRYILGVNIYRCLQSSQYSFLLYLSHCTKLANIKHQLQSLINITDLIQLYNTKCFITGMPYWWHGTDGWYVSDDTPMAEKATHELRITRKLSPYWNFHKWASYCQKWEPLSYILLLTAWCISYGTDHEL